MNNIIDSMMLAPGRMGTRCHHVCGMKDTLVCVIETAIAQLPDVTLIEYIIKHIHTHTPYGIVLIL